MSAYECVAYTGHWCEFCGEYNGGGKFCYNCGQRESEDFEEEAASENQDNFTERICENDNCKKEFHTYEPHYYDEETGVCYCCVECFIKSTLDGISEEGKAKLKQTLLDM